MFHISTENMDGAMMLFKADWESEKESTFRFVQRSYMANSEVKPPE